MKDSKMKHRYTASNNDETVMTDQKKPEELQDDDLDEVCGGVSLNYEKIEWTYTEFEARRRPDLKRGHANSLTSMKDRNFFDVDVGVEE